MKTFPTFVVQRLNQTMTKIFEEASKEGLTISSLFKATLSSENMVTQYLRNMDIDPNSIRMVLIASEDSTSAEAGLEFPFDEIVEKIFANIRIRGHRFINEVVFWEGVLQFNKEANTFMKNILSRFIEPEIFASDLAAMLPTTPIRKWEANSGGMLESFGKNLTQAAIAGETLPALNRDMELQHMIQILIRKTKSNPILIGEPGTGKTAIAEGLAHTILKKEGIPSKLANTEIYQLDLAAIVSAGQTPGELEKILDAIINEASRMDAVLFIDEVHIIMSNHARIANALKPAMARGAIRLIGATTEREYKEAFDSDEAMQRRFQPIRIKEPDSQSVYRILQQKAKQMEEFSNVILPNDALLKAIQLSDRYLTSRNQPDKAIDLIEESASRVRMALESKPDRMLTVQDKIGTLEIEKEMMQVKFSSSGEVTPREQKKLDEISEKISAAKEELDKITAVYTPQKELLEQLVAVKENKSELEAQLDEAIQLGAFKLAMDIREKQLPDLQNQIQKIEAQILEEISKTPGFSGNVVLPEVVAKVVESWTGIPVGSQEQDDIQKYKNMATELKKKVHGQDRAIDIVSKAIKRSKAGLANAAKPIGSFLCLGPTGVGKTYLAQQLAAFVFGTDKVIHRFDMSEYMEPHSVSKLFGAPPGYVGYEQGGQLTEAIRRQPYSVILFDEIEKAHPEVFDTLLQVLDAGRMTDGRGKTVDFSNTIIIMTSNIGAHMIRHGLENNHSIDVIESVVEQELLKNFRPEFLNRFDSKIVFNSLGLEDVVKIADSELQKFAETIMSENGYEIHWAPTVSAAIALKSYDVMNGARPVKRFINENIINQITDLVLEGQLHEGDLLYIGLLGQEITVTKVTLEELDDIKANEVAPVIDQATIKKVTKKAKKKSKKLAEVKKKSKTTVFPETKIGDWD